VTPESTDPSRLAAVGATELERRLLAAGARERPSPEATRRMRQALGLSVGAAALTAGAATGAAKTTTATATAMTKALFWARLSSGVLAVAVAGGVIGARMGTRAPAVIDSTPAVAVAAPAATERRALDPRPLDPRPLDPRPLDPRPLSLPLSQRGGERGKNMRARHPAVTFGGDLRGEIALVDEARAALRAGAPERTLELVRRYERAYRAGTFRPEVGALRIEALAAAGHAPEARALARRFVAEHPDSPLAARVSHLAGE
jgi:hypothetical protein